MIRGLALVFACAILTWSAPAQAWGGSFLFRAFNSGAYRQAQTTWSFEADGQIADVLLPSGESVTPLAFAYGTQDRDAWRTLKRRRVVANIGTGVAAVGGITFVGGVAVVTGTLVFAIVEGITWGFASLAAGQSAWRTVSWGNPWPGEALYYGTIWGAYGLIVAVVGVAFHMVGRLVAHRTRRLEEWFTNAELEQGVEVHNQGLRRGARLHLPEMRLEAGPGSVRLAVAF